MNLTEILEKFPRRDKTNRTAELAALILSRSIKVEPVSTDDVAQWADGVAFPKPEHLAPHIAAHIAVELVSRAERLQKLAEIDCNHGLTEAQERTQGRLTGEVEALGTFAGFIVQTGGDPRGAVVKLFDPADERAGDGFGGGWPVYR